MKKRKSPVAVLLMAAGLCMMAAAAWMLYSNISEERTAAQSSAAVLEQITLPTPAATPSPQPEEEQAPVVVTPAPTEAPLYIQNPDLEMPIKEIDGHEYIGVLQIPKLDLEFPVMSDWSYPKLKLAPCRYEGSIYRGDMVILGHNYTNHFRRFNELETGDLVIFTDMDSNVFRYEVTSNEILRQNEGERLLEEGEWDLTMFTCVRGQRQKRITIRCSLLSE